MIQLYTLHLGNIQITLHPFDSICSLWIDSSHV
nr:unnamed protein product [Callosobruchus analis]CAI5850303.1 unnamed protein product [Callosobruchus analis]